MDQPNVNVPNTNFRYAGFGLRFLAYMVDIVILLPLGFIIQVMLGDSPLAIFEAQTLKELQELQSATDSLPLLLICLLFGAAYLIFFWVNYDGATPGKKLLGIKIVRDNGEKLTYASAFIRWLGFLLSSFTVVFFYIGFLWILWDKKKQALHDKISGTIVVRTDKQPKIAVAVFLTIFAIAAFLGYMGLAVFQGFRIGMREAQQSKTMVPEEVLQDKLIKNREEDAASILSFAPSSCGITIPVPKFTDTHQGKERKWLYEEVLLDPKEFYVLDKDVYPVKQVQGAFLGYKDASSRLEGKTFSVAYPGLIVYCVDNAKSFTLDEYMALALTNKTYQIEVQEKVYAGKVELLLITLQGKNEEGREVKDFAFLGVTESDSKLLYIKTWGVKDDDPNKAAIEEDLNIVFRNLMYRGQEGSPANLNVEGVSDTRSELPFNLDGVNSVSKQFETE